MILKDMIKRQLLLWWIKNLDNKQLGISTVANLMPELRSNTAKWTESDWKQAVHEATDDLKKDFQKLLNDEDKPHGNE